MAALTIGEVAQQAGMRPSALRYYESIGIVPRATRVNGRRRYGAEVLQRLAVIQLAQQAGFTLAEIGTLFEGFEDNATPSSRWQALAEQKLPEVEEQIARARAMKRFLKEGLRCGCLTLEECAIVERQMRSSRPAG